MTDQPRPKTTSIPSRREFLQRSGAAALGGAIVAGLPVMRSAHAAGSETLKVGLIGCGGRGTGAAADALQADADVKLVAMADTFDDRLQSSLERLKKQQGIGEKVAVDPDRCFIGFDAHQRLIDSDVDVVILTTPPHFRPAHLKAAVAAGKHVFCEKPVAVDAPGVRQVLATCEEAKQKNLSIVSGLCWRYDTAVRETIQRILDGAIGDIIAIQPVYNTGQLWLHPRKPEWSDMEYQIRNWLYYTWLSGDHNTEQHVHSLDKAAWLMGDEPPLQATGLGGRQVRVEPEYGNIFDHHAVTYEYPNGVKVFAQCRQQDGCSNDVSDYVLGTEGRADTLRFTIQDRNGATKWRYRGKKKSMYQNEHDELFASIRSGHPINNGLYMARSTMLAILGRMSTYTGQTITWEQAINSQEDLTPPAYEWGDLAVPSVAMPGRTAFV